MPKSKRATPDSFLGRLDAAIDAAGISREELAKRIGLSGRAVISNWNERIPGGDTLLRAAKELQADPYYLLWGTEGGEIARALPPKLERALEELGHEPWPGDVIAEIHDTLLKESARYPKSMPLSYWQRRIREEIARKRPRALVGGAR